MKKIFLAICFMLSVVSGWAQDMDATLAEPQVLELSVSTPQPRLKETFQISVEVSHLRANIFKSLAGKVRLSTDINNTENRELTMNVNALKKGKFEVGPLEFYLDKTKYTTNKIVYEVVDALPDTDKGVWFRKVMVSETAFCIIIEQRIPASSKTTENDNTISFTTEPAYNELVKFKDSYSIAGLRGSSSNANTNFGSVVINGVEKQYMYGYSVYYFNIEDRNAKIKITKDKFQNIPAGYVFEDIIIQ